MLLWVNREKPGTENEICWVKVQSDTSSSGKHFYFGDGEGLLMYQFVWYGSNISGNVHSLSAFSKVLRTHHGTHAVKNA